MPFAFSSQLVSRKSTRVSQLQPCISRHFPKHVHITFDPTTIFRQTTKRLKRRRSKTKQPTFKAAIDSGASDHFFPTSFTTNQHQPITDGAIVRVANDETIQATATDVLPFPELPSPARTCQKFDTISLPLISVGKLCDNGMCVLFNATTVWIYNFRTKQVVLTGYRDPHSKLYLLPHAPPRVPSAPVPRVDHLHQCFSAYEVQTVSHLINFLHASCCHLPISTWKEATSLGYLSTFHGLITQRIRKYCLKKEETAIGHLRLIKKNIRPTSSKRLRSKRHDCGVFLLDNDDMQNLIAMDPTGRYPITSARGHKYIFVLYDFDSNYISAIPIKSCKTNKYIRAFRE